MKLVHVVPHIDQEAAGPSYSVPRLCQSLADYDNDVEISCLAARNDIVGVSVDVHPQWPVMRKFAISTSLATAMLHKSDVVDVVHNHSLWSMVNVAAGWAVPGRRAKLVTSPRGTLSAWALNHSATLKRLMWPLQRRALARADLLHATSDEEYAEIRAQGFSAPIAMVPNGIDLPDMVCNPMEGGEGNGRTLLFLSRIHPKKGIDNLLHAWVQVQHHFPEWRLVVAGRGDAAHVEGVKNLAKSLNAQRVEFPGPLYGKDKANAYWGADLFILPTHSENFGMVVAEALAHECPAIVGKGAPWAELESKRCGWWVHNDIPTLAATLNSSMQLSKEELKMMGCRGRIWMEKDYSWNAIGKKMDAAYRWLVSGGECPAWVKLN